MAEGLATLEGEAIDFDQSEAQFAAAMAAPPSDKPGMAAPARKPPEPAPDPENAPHGWTWRDGEWKAKQAPGRPRSAGDKPRVAAGPAPAAKAAAKPASPKAAPAKDYRKVVGETLEGLWFTMATAPIPDTAFGYRLTGIRTRLRVQAGLIEQNINELVGGTTTVAAHSPFVARLLDRLSSGESGLWILPAVTLMAPFVAATAQLWTGKLGSEEELEKLATKTEESAAEWVQLQLQAAAA